MEKYISIITTTKTKENAKSIIKKILDDRLSPCIQQFPIQSTFIWNDEIQDENEIMLIIKAKKSKKNEIKENINNLHDYKVPEVIFYDFNILNHQYKKWFDEQL
tara:strand:- start:188 stop:499 length:312 start_codon:yes stop_codon:yes gene_type:complete